MSFESDDDAINNADPRVLAALNAMLAHDGGRIVDSGCEGRERFVWVADD